MKIAVLRYNAGNILSVSYILDRLGCNYFLTSNAEEIMKADKVIFPGVGEASSTMKFLKSNKLDSVIRSLNQPVLGICLGMQLLCKHSEENNTACLGVFKVDVKKFEPTREHRVPHMGWNELTQVEDWIPGSAKGGFVYFAHSFYVPVNQYTVATSVHTTSFSAALKKDNFYALQFHPEKSGQLGEEIIKGFIDL